MTQDILYTPIWLKTPSGNNIEMYQKIHTPKGFHILFIGGVHGDEPEGVVLAESFLDWLQKNSTVHNWTLIPCLNIDGYRGHQRTNANGVDLNRNFPTKDWSPEAKAPRYSPGPFPNSEVEVVALCQWLTANKPDLIVHFHSWEPSITYTGPAALPAAEVLGSHSGYSIQDDIGYPTPGSLGHYGWQELGTPVICIEAQEKSDLSTVWPIFKNGLVHLMTETAWADKQKSDHKMDNLS